MKMRMAIVSTYPPRACGIGTFSRDLRSALLETDPSLRVDVVSIVRDQHPCNAPEVLSVIRQDVRADYVATSALLTARGIDVVLIEHEYGIFGGEAGSYVLSLVQELEQPFVVTLHTVLSTPTERQAEVLTALCQRAALVTVFTETARRMVIDAGVVVADRVCVVPHGAPAILLSNVADAAWEEDAVHNADGLHPTMAKLRDRTVLSTFGLISAGKGIETAIKALAMIVPSHPDVLYLVAGQTHPEVVSNEGERYRMFLERLVRDHHLEQHVQFLDQFLPVEELAFLLSSTDIYLTPYRSREQIVSGALTFAVVAGCPVVSTPYFYAEDLLASGAGVLVDFDDPAAFAKGVLQYLDHPDELTAAAAEAKHVGAGLIWPSVGAMTVDVLRQAMHLGAPANGGGNAGRVAPSPSIRPEHLRTLVDDVGMQHADGVVPNKDGTGGSGRVHPPCVVAVS
jgi:glycosyltransferase involved in cell wall biosynthesis